MLRRKSSRFSQPEFPTAAVITGAAGFLGHGLVRRLTDSQCCVVAVSRRPDEVPSKAARVAGDVGDAATWERVAACLPTDRAEVVVFHMGAIASVRACEENPAAAIRANVDAVRAVAEACTRLGVRRIIFPSTGLVYRPRPRGFLREDDSLAPASLYAATKAAAEYLLGCYSSAFGLSCDVARLSTAYGPRASPDSVVGTLLKQTLNGQPLHVRAGRPVRDFLFEEDVLDGLLALARCRKTPGLRVFNLSSGRGTSIRSLGLIMERLVRREVTYEDAGARKPTQVDRLVLANSRLRAWTGWRPSHSLVTGLRRTLDELRRSDR